MYYAIPLKADYKNILSAQFIYDFPLIKKLDDKTKIDLGCSYHFKNKIRTGNAKLVLWSFTGSAGRGKEVEYSKYISVPIKVRRSYSARLGLFIYNHTVSVMNDGNEMDGGGLPYQAGGAISTNGTEFGGAVTSTSAIHYNKDYDSHLHNKSIYFGISTNTYKKILADVDGYGKRSFRSSSSFYLDYFIGSTKIDDLVIDGIEYDISGDGAEGFEPRGTGWRLGYEFSKTYLWARFEYGKLPGLKTYKTYFNLAMGFYINFNKNPFDYQFE
jgi:hypothetical protein